MGRWLRHKWVAGARRRAKRVVRALRQKRVPAMGVGVRVERIMGDRLRGKRVIRHRLRRKWIIRYGLRRKRVIRHGLQYESHAPGCPFHLWRERIIRDRLGHEGVVRLRHKRIV